MNNIYNYFNPLNRLKYKKNIYGQKTSKEPLIVSLLGRTINDIDKDKEKEKEKEKEKTKEKSKDTDRNIDNDNEKEFDDNGNNYIKVKQSRRKKYNTKYVSHQSLNSDNSNNMNINNTYSNISKIIKNINDVPSKPQIDALDKMQLKCGGSGVLFFIKKNGKPYMLLGNEIYKTNNVNTNTIRKNNKLYKLVEDFGGHYKYNHRYMNPTNITSNILSNNTFNVLNEYSNVDTTDKVSQKAYIELIQNNIINYNRLIAKSAQLEVLEETSGSVLLNIDDILRMPHIDLIISSKHNDTINGKSNDALRFYRLYVCIVSNFPVTSFMENKSKLLSQYKNFKHYKNIKCWNEIKEVVEVPFENIINNDYKIITVYASKNSKRTLGGSNIQPELDQKCVLEIEQTNSDKNNKCQINERLIKLLFGSNTVKKINNEKFCEMSTLDWLSHYLNKINTSLTLKEMKDTSLLHKYDLSSSDMKIINDYKLSVFH